MRMVTLYIAMSLDGFIADRQGGVGWLNGHNDPAEPDSSSLSFLQGVDTIIMGWTTYHQITTELSPDHWVYDSLISYVITHRPLPATDNILFTIKDPAALVRRLRQTPGKAIWICGGGSIIHPLMAERLIDQYHISIVPTILGSGISLFDTIPEEQKLRLVHTQTQNGIVELVYVPRA